jgi:hypothetical protein
MNTLQKYHPNEQTEQTESALTLTAPASWTEVRYYVGLATKCAQAGLAAQVMAGFALAELRKQHGTNQGRRRDLPATSPNDSDKLNWPELVKKHAGVSDDTARNWIRMAEGIKARWKKLAPQDRLHELMRLPVSDWTDQDAELVSDAVAKVTDGSTQLEFMRELGIAKQRQGAGATGRAPGCDNTRKELSLSEEAEWRRTQALEDWSAMAKGHAAYKDKFTLLPDEDVTAQIASLEPALKARKEWLRQPLNKRDAKAIAEMFAPLSP